MNFNLCKIFMFIIVLKFQRFSLAQRIFQTAAVSRQLRSAAFNHIQKLKLLRYNKFEQKYNSKWKIKTRKLDCF